MNDADTTTTNFNCASCGKEGGNLNTCNKCKMVKYCNAACKKKHRSKHKKACERRVAELYDEKLFKEHPPPKECPICFLPLPLNEGESIFQSCCGQVICRGCMYAMFEEARGRGGEVGLCAFCRTLPATSDKERVKRMKKLMDADNADGYHQLAILYVRGDMGMPRDFAKANELFLKAGELGCSEAYYNLGNSYCSGRGVEVDNKKVKHFCELAAMNGNVLARHHLGCEEIGDSNYHRAYKHFTLAAKAGCSISLDKVKIGFMRGIVTKDEYANTLRAHQERHNGIKSDDRDRANELFQDV